jgi:hypothetical protein
MGSSRLWQPLLPQAVVGEVFPDLVRDPNFELFLQQFTPPTIPGSSKTTELDCGEDNGLIGRHANGNSAVHISIIA